MNPKPKSAGEMAEEIIKFVACQQAKPFDTTVTITPKQLDFIEQAILAYHKQEVGKLLKGIQECALRACTYSTDSGITCNEESCASCHARVVLLKHKESRVQSPGAKIE